ncbi:hypothetical protein C8R47DRAFT_1082804 [Mycena vitilis]|nr:hypothetical protein C8R47DRAFT_1082804 [Mycena vitilis]
MDGILRPWGEKYWERVSGGVWERGGYRGAGQRRCNSCTDGVPTIIPEVLGYQHHSTEYWQFEDPDSSTDETTTVTKCSGDEDPTCSDSIPSGGIDAEHVFYFGQGTLGFSLSSDNPDANAQRFSDGDKPAALRMIHT